MRYLRRIFTKWYIKKGYTFGYNYSSVEFIGGDEIFPPMPIKLPECYYNCPRYIYPLLFLFSPSIYYIETVGKAIADGFIKGLNSETEEV